MPTTGSYFPLFTNSIHLFVSITFCTDTAPRFALYRRLDIHDDYDSNFFFSPMLRSDLFTINISNAVIIRRQARWFPCSTTVNVILFHFSGTAPSTRIAENCFSRHLVARSYKTVTAIWLHLVIQIETTTLKTAENNVRNLIFLTSETVE